MTVILGYDRARNSFVKRFQRKTGQADSLYIENEIRKPVALGRTGTVKRADIVAKYEK